MNNSFTFLSKFTNLLREKINVSKVPGEFKITL